MEPEQLIHRYLSGESTEEEIRQLELWVSANAANQAAFRAYRQSWNLSALESQPEIDVDRGWAMVQNKISGDSQNEVVRIRAHRQPLNIRSWARYAAVLVFLITALFWAYQRFLRDDVSFLEAESLVSVNALPDGSTVSLNRQASIRFSNQKIRKATLQGDAFFEVQRDETRPFVVQTGDLRIQVLGTAFYVDARKDQPLIEVMVESGLVSVRYRQDSLILNPGQRARFDKTSHELSQSIIEDVNYLSWKTKSLVFKDKPLSDVIDKINEVYQSQVVLEDPNLGGCRITVSFMQQELDAMLTIMAETLDLGIERKAGQIVLSGKPCQ